MFNDGATGLGKYDGDFQYKMLSSIEMRVGTPPSVFPCIPPPHFSIFFWS